MIQYKGDKMSFISESTEICRGCSYDGDMCGVKFRNITIERLKLCPCTDCLIKVMCHRQCKERGTYYNTITLDMVEKGKNERNTMHK
jgi:hypothetical protein